MLKQHGLSVESLPHDVVELILERLPMDSLLRLKSVSKNWKSTIDSRRSQQGQFIHRRQSRGPDVLCVPLGYGSDEDAYAIRFVFGRCSSKASTVWFPVSRNFDIVVVNPATRWHQSFPLSNVQHFSIEKYNKCEFAYPLIPRLGFGKDKVTGTYKPVYLYNSHDFKLGNVTTCEVFDFRTNAWRYVVPSSPYRIFGHYEPVYLDGSLYDLIKEETELLSLDLHTETFQGICKGPFVRPLPYNPYSITMCILDDRLCVSEKVWPIQEIWSFDGANKTWMKMCSINLTRSVFLFEENSLVRSSMSQLPIAILDKNRLLLRGNYDLLHTLVIHDLYTKSFDLLFKPTKRVGTFYYFESLFSV
ncbi:hypothetical protein BRARA_I05194 [Brassica rapa]|uniref:F-box domain-containing protein n=1 Tax=Brassica campestris TaxID=3711 RepID=A0A397Y7G3_BRACM|nr:hypothetical protein BRARA_I05194 [Brassica rapa]